MKCKKTVMGLAALLIVVFHFWILLSPTMAGKKIESNIINTLYFGVDLFFLVSGYSLGQQKKIKYGSFILNRLLSVYLPFVVLAVVCFFYKHWTFTRLWQVVCGVEFFKKGGGSFLWFVIGIMMVYLLAPFMVKLKIKLKGWALPVLLGIWAVLALTLQFALGYTTIHILINRLPIFFIGMFYDDIRSFLFGKKRLPFTLPLMAAGLIGGYVLIYKFGGTVKLNQPISETYYIIAIPFIIALTAWFDFTAEHCKVKNVPMDFLGTMTLELYGLQMIFGYDIEGFALKKLMELKKNIPQMPNILMSLLSFIVTLVVLVLMAWAFSMIRRLIKKLRTRIFSSKGEMKK